MVQEVQSASNDDLARYLMDDIIRLEDAYVKVLEADGFTISNETHLDKALPSITQADTEGAALNIPWKTTAAAATASNAFRKAAGR